LSRREGGSKPLVANPLICRISSVRWP